MYLRIRIIDAAQANGSWKAIAEVAGHVLNGMHVMRVRDDSNRVGLRVGQDNLCPLQPILARGNQVTPFSPTVPIRKGDWIVRTPYGGLILSPNEYQALVLQGGWE